MRILVGAGALSPQPGGAAVTVGTFDGVHVGHRALLARARALAKGSGGTSVAVTWDRHPFATLRPDAVPPLLTTPQRKAELIAEAGVDVLVVLPFDAGFASWPPERFVRDVLVALGAYAVVVGRGWRFGHRAAGDIRLLSELGRRWGFSVEEAPLVEVAGAPASSTRARRAVAEGDMELARALLGRPFDLSGVVLRGDRRGTRLGYPTANLAVDPALAHPPRGVYAGRAHPPGSSPRPAAINVGVNPTFGGDPASTPWRVEAHLLDFDGDLYDRELRVEFHLRLRDEERFASVDELLEAMARDVRATRELLGAAPPTC